MILSADPVLHFDGEDYVVVRDTISIQRVYRVEEETGRLKRISRFDWPHDLEFWSGAKELM